MTETQESIESIKYGLCKAMSEKGISPSQFEDIIKHAGVFDIIKDLNPAKAIGPAFTIALGGGALAGIGTAALRHKIEHMGDGTEDSEMRRSRMKIEMYKKMISDLKSDQASLPA